MAREITLCHHERWDGTGYPAKLAGEKIPLAARIVAIADVYDAALSSRRVYKERFPHERCVQVIKEGAGKSFDPAIVAVFLELEADFREIARRYRDAKEPLGAGPASGRRSVRRAFPRMTVLSAVLEFAEQCRDELSSATTSPLNTLEIDHVP